MARQVWTQDGHVPYWDGEVWTCPRAGDTCSFEPTTKDGGALYHYWVNGECPRTEDE